MKTQRFWMVLLALCSAGSARAGLITGPMTYTETATASGSFNGVGFTNQLVTISLTANTSNIMGTFAYSLNGMVTVSVGGGSGIFTDMTGAYDIPIDSYAGFADGGFGPILYADNAAFATYNLSAPIGPLTGSSFIQMGESFPTTGGALILNSAGNATFTATAAPNPEPATFGLLSIGFAGIAIRRRRRRV